MMADQLTGSPLSFRAIEHRSDAPAQEEERPVSQSKEVEIMPQLTRTKTLELDAVQRIEGGLDRCGGGEAKLMWIVSLHSAACRQWLSWNPPRLDEATESLRQIERMVQQKG